VALLAVFCGCRVLTAQPAVETSFEKGTDAPEGWKSVGGPSTWEQGGRTGAKCVRLDGDGKCSSGWVLQPLPLEPRRTYRLSVWYRSDSKGENKSGVMVIMAGSLQKIYRHSPDWTLAEFVFRTPDSLDGTYLRFGQWHFLGTCWYDDCRIEPVSLAFEEKDGVVLDRHERIEKGAYIFEPDFLTDLTNCCRVEQGHTVQFHHDKWWFHTNQYLIHEYRVGAHRQRSGSIRLRITYEDPRIDDNRVTVEAGPDGKTWTELGSYDVLGEQSIELPQRLFPTDRVFVRMRGQGSMQVRTYQYTAQLEGSAKDLRGRTSAFRGQCVTVDNGVLRLTLEEGGRWLVSVARQGRPVGGLACVIAQFERAGVGYKGTGVDVAEATRVKDIEIVADEPTRCVLRVTAVREESAEARRKFEATYELTVYAGRNWFESKLVSVRNTDAVPYELRGYFHLLQPTGPGPWRPVCFPEESAWVNAQMMLGAATRQENDLTLGLRLSGIAACGDITRGLRAELAPGQVWTGAEPGVIIFTGDGVKPEDIVRQARDARDAAASPEKHADGTIVVRKQGQDDSQP